MAENKRLDIFQRRSRIRRRLAAATAAFVLIATGVSIACLYVLSRASRLDLDFWLLLAFFWLGILLLATLRYAVSGRRSAKRMAVSPPSGTDRRLESALEAVKLASSMEKRVRLFETPHEDTNAFSLSLPDGSHALFATRGVARALPEREQEAVMAHEIAHMQAGDTFIHTLMLYLAGWPPITRASGVRRSAGPNPMTMGMMAAVVGLTLFVITTVMASTELGVEDTEFSPAAFRPSVAFILLAFALGFPVLVYKLLQKVLNKGREHYADMETAYLTRGPEAVWLALKHTADDVLNVLLLPPVAMPCSSTRSGTTPHTVHSAPSPPWPRGWSA